MDRFKTGVGVCAVAAMLAGCAERGGTVGDGPSPEAASPVAAAAADAAPLTLALVLSSPDADAPHITVSSFTSDELFEIWKHDFDEDTAARLLAVSVASDDDAAPLPPMLGERRIAGDALLFEPAFPLQPGLQYRAAFDPTVLPALAHREPIVQIVSLPERAAGPPTVVEAVYPSQDVLPENLLKFYLHFSAPMSRGEAYSRIRLLRESGEQIEDPFLELGEELWDVGGTRFTLFFDPGRIKRYVTPREEIGPALEEGGRYELIIDAGWPDAEGRPLAEEHRKPFRVAAPDDVPPDAARWEIAAPEAATTDPLEVVFDEPLDHAMLGRVFHITDADGRPVAGEVEIDRAEMRWRFRPASAWQSGRYALLVDTTLEDRAGNSLARPFEVDLVGPDEESVVPDTISVPFDVR